MSSDQWSKHLEDAASATTPPATTPPASAKTTPPRDLRLVKVDDNVQYGRLMMRLYDDNTLALSEHDFAISIPVFGLAATSIAMLAFGTDDQTVAGVGLGAGAFEVARRQLDFAGRAKVLSDGITSWKCFKDAAQDVVFLDTSGANVYASDLGTKKDALVKLIAKADSAAIDPTNSGAQQSIEALREARAAAQQTVPIAERVIRAAVRALATLDDERFLIESSIRHRYAGVVKPFEASAGRQLVLDAFKQFAIDQSATADIHRSFTRSTVQSATAKAVTNTAHVATLADNSTEDVAKLVESLKEAAEPFTNTDAQAVLNLSKTLAACPR